MMRLCYDHSPAAGEVRVSCYRCGRMRPMAEMLMDLNGPSFQAYYCPECLPAEEPKQVTPCTRYGCLRRHPV